MSEIKKILRERDATQDFFYRLSKTIIGKKYSGHSYSRDAARAAMGHCAECNGFLVLSENDDFVCEDCGESVLYGYYYTFNDMYNSQ